MSCNSNSKDLPILSYTIDDTGQKNYYNISYRDFRNQLDESFSTETIKGNICIANFFFTSCPSICPPMRTELIAIAESFSDEENVMIISHTIDPIHDSVSVLKTYSEATGIPDHKWQFLRASEEKTKSQATMYMTNFKPNEEGTDFYHSSYVALVDQKQQIRGFYNVLLSEDVDRLKADLERLLR
ncbi:SCO family protein [Psychroserpens sp.]|uniref:SCO family protein n=1 Tax=Psychroserpens sp. TaxID=2020870 RepID=UPI002B26F5B5|nr:SCO family protein [Psychroserpens sp.]